MPKQRYCSVQHSERGTVWWWLRTRCDNQLRLQRRVPHSYCSRCRGAEDVGRGDNVKTTLTTSRLLLIGELTLYTPNYTNDAHQFATIFSVLLEAPMNDKHPDEHPYLRRPSLLKLNRYSV